MWENLATERRRSVLEVPCTCILTRLSVSVSVCQCVCACACACVCVCVCARARVCMCVCQSVCYMLVAHHEGRRTEAKIFSQKNRFSLNSARIQVAKTSVQQKCLSYRLFSPRHYKCIQRRSLEEPVTHRGGGKNYFRFLLE